MPAGIEWQIHAAITRALVLIASLWFCCGVVLAADEQPSATEMMEDLMYGRGTVGGPFTLTDQNGRKRSDSEFRGKLMIVYFGYTFCPDVCPADLMAITQALDALGAAAEGIQPVFITVDPERDTTLLKDYVAAFHQGFIGLTGSPEEIRKIANSYKAYFRKVPRERNRSSRTTRTRSEQAREPSRRGFAVSYPPASPDAAVRRRRSRACRWWWSAPCPASAAALPG